MCHPHDYAVAAVEQRGSVQFTWDDAGHTVYMGHIVSVPHVLQKAQQKGIDLYQRTIIDSGLYYIELSRKKK